MSVMDRINKLVKGTPEGESVEITLPPAERDELESETVARWEAFNDLYEATCKTPKSVERYATIKSLIELTHPTGRPLSRQEIANEARLAVGSTDRYIRLFKFENAYNASTRLYDFIVVLADGSGHLLLTPTHQDVLDHHKVLRKRVESTLATIDAVEYTSLVGREG